MGVSYKRILIIKPSSLGDIVHALPALESLRRTFPNAWISWLVKSEWAEILEGNPSLNEILLVDPRFRSWCSLIKSIRKKRYDLVVDLQGLLRSGLIAILSGASVRVGFAQGREGSPLFYTDRVQLPNSSGKSWRLLNIHAVERNLAVVKRLGANTDKPYFWLPRLENDVRVVDQWLKESRVTEEDRLVAIAPQTRQHIKNWPMERFIEVAAALAKNDNLKILLLGSNLEEKICCSFQDVLGSCLINLVGRTRIRQLSVIFDRVNLLISNDSAPLHIAAAGGTPVLTIFGPTNPQVTGPYGKGNHEVLTHTLPCRPCGEQICRNIKLLECMTSISVKQVVQAAQRIMAIKE